MNVDKRFFDPSFPTIRVESSADGDVHWMFMHHDAAGGSRPCFRDDLLDDMWSFTDAITLGGGDALRRGQLRHFVLASDANVFNLGGDLELFSQLIRLRDRAGLLAYAKRCVEGVYTLHTGLGGDVRTIALLQGDALGGGLEMALACHTIVAEEGVGMGLPEIMFGLFPGMGAYSFLCKRVPPQLAERIILEGTVYSSEQMHALGVVDILVPKGEGKGAVEELIRNQKRSKLSYLAMNAARRISQQVPLQELMAITELWVDTALALDDKSLRTMDRVVRAQTRRAQNIAALA